MTLKNSDKMMAIIELGKMEHGEIKIIYQFIVGGIISVSVAVLVAIFQGYLTLNNAMLFLIGFSEFAFFIYLIIKDRMKKVRRSIANEIMQLEGKK